MIARFLAPAAFLVACLLLFASLDDADARPRDRRAHYLTLANQIPPDSGIPQPLADESLYATLILWIHSHNTTHAWQQDTTANQTTHPTADTDSLGQIDDPSRRAHVVQAQSTARRPTVNSTGGRPYINFDGTGGTDVIQVMNSNSAFNTFQESRLGTIMIELAHTQADGTTVAIADNDNRTTANNGFWVDRTSANRYNVGITAGGSTRCNHTTTATHLAADGFVWFIWRGNGSGGVTMRVGAAGSDESFSCAAAGAAGTATRLLTFGGSSALSGSTSYRMRHALIFDTRLSDGQVTQVISDVGALVRTTDSMVVTRPAAEGFYNFLSRWYNFTDATTVFEDGPATNAAESGDPVLAVRDPRDLSNLMGRAATSTGANAPTWATTDGLHWGGSSDETLSWTASPVRAGAKTLIVNVTNEDATLGSHFAHGSLYAVMTGDNYASNPSGAAYYTVHAVGGAPIQVTLASETSWNWIEIMRNGSSWTGTCDGANQSTGTEATQWTPATIGREANTGWRMHGNQRQVFEFNAPLTATQIARVRAGP